MATDFPRNGFSFLVQSISDTALEFNQFLATDGHWKWVNRDGTVALDWAPDGTITLSTPGSGGVWNDSATYPAGAIVIDRGGTWQATAPNTNSQPVSGNTDWTLVGGTPYVDIVLTPEILTTAPYMNAFAVITAVNQGTKTFDFTSMGPYGESLTAGMQFTVEGSTGNDGTYTVVSATETSVTVVQAISSAVADGGFRLTDPGVFVMSASSSGLVALPSAVHSITSEGDAFASQSAADIFQSNAPADIFFAVNDALDGNDGDMPELQVSEGIANIISAEITELDAKGGEWKIWSGTDITNGGATMGTRSVTHRIFYTMVSVS